MAAAAGVPRQWHAITCPPIPTRQRELSSVSHAPLKPRHLPPIAIPPVAFQGARHLNSVASLRWDVHKARTLGCVRRGQAHSSGTAVVTKVLAAPTVPYRGSFTGHLRPIGAQRGRLAEARRHLMWPEHTAGEVPASNAVATANALGGLNVG